MPPGTSGSSPLAGVYSTNGSAPSTRSLVVRVSVALIATFASLTPASPQIPSLRSAFGTAVYCSGSSGRVMVRWEITDLYSRGCSSGFTTMKRFGLNSPFAESSLRAMMVEPS